MMPAEDQAAARARLDLSSLDYARLCPLLPTTAEALDAWRAAVQHALDANEAMALILLGCRDCSPSPVPVPATHPDARQPAHPVPAPLDSEVGIPSPYPATVSFDYYFPSASPHSHARQ